MNTQESMLAAITSRGLMDVVDDNTEYRFQLLQENDSSQVFAIPASAMFLLIQMLTEMGQGKAVTLTSIQEEITTQQAANILNELTAYAPKLGEMASTLLDI